MGTIPKVPVTKKGEVITTSPFLVTGTFGYGAQFFLVPVI